VDLVELAMVYDADAGVVGELRYFFGKLAGRHCGLCDITHGTLRPKPAFEDLRYSMGMPVQIWHRNEQPADVAEFTASRTPIVVGRRADGTLVELLAAAALDGCEGDVERFAVKLDRALVGVGSRGDGEMP